MHLLCRLIVPEILEETRVYLEQRINHLFSRTRYSLNMTIKLYSLLRALQKNSICNFVEINLRVMDPEPDQSKLRPSNHLRLYEAMNVPYVLEFFHQFSKILGLRIARKHGIVYHTQ